MCPVRKPGEYVESPPRLRLPCLSQRCCRTSELRHCRQTVSQTMNVVMDIREVITDDEDKAIKGKAEDSVVICPERTSQEEKLSEFRMEI